MTVSGVSTAFLLSGGRGTRLRDVFPDRPKAMAPVGGRPFAEWLILALRKQGIRRIVFCTGHLAEQIESHFRDGAAWNLEITYSSEASPQGTAGALALAVSRNPLPFVLALNADSYCPWDLDRLRASQAERQAPASLWLVRVEDLSRFGSVALDADGRVQEFVEKSEERGSGLISAGIYLFDRAVLDALPASRPLSLERDVLPDLASAGALWGVAGEGPFLDIGTPASYAQAESFLAVSGLR